MIILAKTFRLISLILLFVLCTACMHKTIARLEEKLERTSGIDSSEDLHREASTLIKGMPGITEEQRQRLRDVQTSTRSELDGIQGESLKLRSVLIQGVLSADGYDQDEVNLIETRIRKLNRRRLNLTFKAVRLVNTILGRDEPRLQKMMAREFLSPDHPPAIAR